jgi:hypothetical protein
MESGRDGRDVDLPAVYVANDHDVDVSLLLLTATLLEMLSMVFEESELGLPHFDGLHAKM